ncbi:hypothetical protein JXQ31_07570 [candidate division KSB1 bacterium]|nr:hypothetical protein [candidate division KSB1 bacterium]
MKRRLCAGVLVLMLFFGGHLFANVTTTQYFYLVKQAFPNASEINIFITKSELAREKEKIDRATVQFKLKALIYEIDNSADIGKATKSLNENSILVIYDDNIFANNKNKLYILSKCKEKKISLVTASLDYIESGALLGYVEKDGAKSIILNLTFYDHLKTEFNVEKIQKLGITEVIPQDYLTSAQ